MGVSQRIEEVKELEVAGAKFCDENGGFMRTAAGIWQNELHRRSIFARLYKPVGMKKRKSNVLYEDTAARRVLRDFVGTEFTELYRLETIIQ